MNGEHAPVGRIAVHVARQDQGTGHRKGHADPCRHQQRGNPDSPAPGLENQEQERPDEDQRQGEGKDGQTRVSQPVETDGSSASSGPPGDTNARGERRHEWRSRSPCHQLDQQASDDQREQRPARGSRCRFRARGHGKDCSPKILRVAAIDQLGPANVHFVLVRPHRPPEVDPAAKP